MAEQPKYLTRDKEGIKQFIDKFDVSQLFEYKYSNLLSVSQIEVLLLNRFAGLPLRL